MSFEIIKFKKGVCPFDIPKKDLSPKKSVPSLLTRCNAYYTTLSGNAALIQLSIILKKI